MSGDDVSRYGDLMTIDNKGHVAPDPVLWRFNTPEGSRCKRLKTLEVAGRQRRYEPSINRDACHISLTLEESHSGGFESWCFKNP
jgi:hypothetical protein